MGRDPYKYFRIEARELLEALSQRVLQIEKSGAKSTQVATMLRHAHTLKGAARVVKQLEIAEHAHEIEELLAPYRQKSGPISTETIEAILGLLDRIQQRVEALQAPGARRETAPNTTDGHALRPAFDTVRVELSALDGLLREIADLGAAQAAIRDDERRFAALLAEAEKPAQRALGPGPGQPRPGLQTEQDWQERFDALRKLQKRLQRDAERAVTVREAIKRTVTRLRLQPAKTMVPALERAIRDAAAETSKAVEFHVHGADIRLDTTVLAAAQEALLHVVRNGVVHGIEPPVERARTGKSTAGTVVLEIERRGEMVVFSCRDDGRGVDAEKIRRMLVEQGRRSDKEIAGLSIDAVLALLFREGVSTAEAVSQVAGRGVGLGVVASVADRFKGEARMRSEPGQQTVVELVLPITLASVSALLVDVEGWKGALPVDAVAGTFRVSTGEISIAAQSATVRWQSDREISFVPLIQLLKPAKTVRPRKQWTGVVVETEDDMLAVGVDRLHGIARTEICGLPRQAGAVPLIGGVAFDWTGEPFLVLDPPAILAAAAGRTPQVVEPQPIVRPPVLVIDDSLTSRMLEKSILESAGYAVDVAVTAEKAMELAHKHRYEVFVVDVELPGMDGFEFIARVNQDKTLRKIPAILVTSRGSAADRRRGMEVGAYAYIVKSEFDQGRMLDIVGKIVGTP
jgi:two-component system chemotaxis sensor kinase CheA